MSKKSVEKDYLKAQTKLRDLERAIKEKRLKSPLLTSESLRNYGIEEIRDARKRKK